MVWGEKKGRGMFPDAVAFSAFIDGLAKAGLVEDAYDVFLEMCRAGFVPNNFTYNSLINGFCNCGKGKMKLAIDAFMDMHGTGIGPDVVTYNTLIAGYCKAFDMVSADDFVNKMRASGWDPDIHTYNTRIHGFCSIRKMNRAVVLLDELVSVGVVPNIVTYNTMVNGVCSDIVDRAMIITAKLIKMAFFPNIITINTLLSHFLKQGMPERALMWGQKLTEVNFDFDEIFYNILDRAYQDIQADAAFFTRTSEKTFFLDFLMYITYDYLYRNRAQWEKAQDPLELIDVSSSMH
ncbi:pentatricopeptide repeat-containing protein At1g09900-like [Carica papaya]|uniref:pentatricopeptide repeat-containing protein At1g09900-like n=1 Tax=Carica papaya TaxID=3649 RepID=UPI000B8CF085|nr:pentatricopeptide repeat-containing protein At1g09900-like [Carica papaya]